MCAGLFHIQLGSLAREELVVNQYLNYDQEENSRKKSNPERIQPVEAAGSLLVRADQVGMAMFTANGTDRDRFATEGATGCFFG